MYFFRPAYGGKFCEGSSRSYKLCNTDPCPPGSVDYRAQQCAEFNGKQFRGWYYTWRPYTRVEGKNTWFDWVEKAKKIRVHFHTRLYPKLALRKKINPCYWVARVKNRIPSSTDSPLIIHQSTPAPTLVFISFHENFFSTFFFTLNARCFLSLVHWIVLLH